MESLPQNTTDISRLGPPCVRLIFGCKQHKLREFFDVADAAERRARVATEADTRVATLELLWTRFVARFTGTNVSTLLLARFFVLAVVGTFFLCGERGGSLNTIIDSSLGGEG